MNTHALLSPSGAYRWLACTPSARLEQQFPDTSGDAAAEGTLAHAISEKLIMLLVAPLDMLDRINADLQQIITEDEGKYYSEEMLDYCKEYAAFVVEQYEVVKAKTSDAHLFLETKFYMNDYAEDCFGTCDVSIVGEPVLNIIDLKYGKGVPVFAENNPQMKLYALGALRRFDLMYDIETVRMTIYQPRLDNITTWEISVAELRQWANDVLRPQAVLAFAGKGEFVPGKHCQFCKAKAACKANADYNLEVARYAFKDMDLLTDAELADIMTKLPGLLTWAKSVDEYALNEVYADKRHLPGFKLVEGRSNRRFSDEAGAIETLQKIGFDETKIFKPRAMHGITELTKLMGKNAFNAMLGDYLTKPKGAPTLVPDNDKRSEYVKATAGEAFAHIVDEIE